MIGARIPGRAVVERVIGILVRLVDDVPTQLALATFAVSALALDLLLEAALRWSVARPNRFDAVVLPVALLGGALAARPLWREARWRMVSTLAGFVLLIAALSACLYDSSWDSESYHFPAVVALAQGWNPLLGSSRMPKPDIWPNGIWTLQAQLFHLSGLAELGKALNGVLALSAFLLCGAASRLLRRRASDTWDAALVLLLVANPVALAQLFTFMLDGAVYYLSLCLLAGLLLVATPHRRIGWIVTASALLLLINTKLSGIYFAALVGLTGWLIAPMPSRARWQTAAIGIAAAAIACGFIGWRPYVTNLITQGTPIVFGPWLLDRPANLIGLPPPLQLALSWLGTTGGTPHSPAQLKIPFLVSPREIWFMATPDPRIAGFGPLFLPALLGAIAGTVIRWREIWSRAPERIPLLAAVAFLAICAGLPEAWQARYGPLGWAVPVLLVMAWPPAPELPWVRRLGAAVVLLALSNSILAFGGNLARLAFFDWRWTQMLAELRPEAPIGLVPSGDAQFHVTFAERLRHTGIPAEPVAIAGCARLLNSYRGMLVCARAAPP